MITNEDHAYADGYTDGRDDANAKHGQIVIVEKTTETVTVAGVELTIGADYTFEDVGHQGPLRLRLSPPFADVTPVLYLEGFDGRPEFLVDNDGSIYVFVLRDREDLKWSVGTASALCMSMVVVPYGAPCGNVSELSVIHYDPFGS